MIIAYVIFLIAAVLIIRLMYKFKYRRFYNLAAKLPGTDKLSILESIWIGLTLSHKKRLFLVLDTCNNDFPMTKLWIMHKLWIVTKDPDTINKIFNSPYTYNKPRIMYRVFVMRNTIVSIDMDEHKRYRRIFNKAFSTPMLQRLPKILDENSKKFIKMMVNTRGSEELNLMEYAGAFTLETFSQSNLNFEMDYFKSYVFDAYDNASIILGTIFPFLIFGMEDTISNMLSKFGKVRSLFKDFNRFVDTILEKNADPDKTEKNTFINLMLDPKNGFNESQIRNQLTMFVLGAFEPTAKTIASAIMMLGMHKEAQEKLTKEIDEIYSHENDTEFTTDFLQKFSYLDMFIKETLRLLPPVPVVGRINTQEMEINGYVIPKDTPMVLSIFSMHRDERFWGKDAHIFRPERFIDGPTNSFAFTPFTAGSRICIGYRYGTIATKIFLINLLRTHRVDSIKKFDELEIEATMVLNIVGGYKASIYKRPEKIIHHY